MTTLQTVNMNMLMQKILSNFPKTGMRLAFAYGSGVFQQHGNADVSKNMIDFVFAVDDSVEWHQENLKHNRKHYSSLAFLGPTNISHIQERFGARIYYNTLVKCEDRVIKYGTISTRCLVDDLLDWESLYVSGRLHKPVEILHLDRTATELTRAMTSNLQSAVHASLLLLPEEFTEMELFTTVAGLSYNGDFRMKVGEDRNKVNSIVAPHVDRFRNLYRTILTGDEHVTWHQSSGRLEQSRSPASTYHHLSLLPRWLMYRVVQARSADGKHRDTEQVLRSLACDSECSECIRSALASIVQRSSLTQTAKGLVTAGPQKSISYGWKKMRKMLKI